MHMKKESSANSALCWLSTQQESSSITTFQILQRMGCVITEVILLGVSYQYSLRTYCFHLQGKTLSSALKMGAEYTESASSVRTLVWYISTNIPPSPFIFKEHKWFTSRSSLQSSSIFMSTDMRWVEWLAANCEITVPVPVGALQISFLSNPYKLYE
jgi:hypothetical protein